MVYWEDWISKLSINNCLRIDKLFIFKSCRVKQMIGKTRKKLGVTLLEIMLSMAILAVIAISSLPFFVTLIGKNRLTSTQTLVAQALRQAAVRAQAGQANSDWGVAVRPEKVVVFSGSDYDNRNGQHDIASSLDGGVNFAGDTEIVFGKVSGTLPVDKNVILTLVSSGEVKTVNVNTQAAVSY